jgi:anti-sigma factor RsiW
MSNTIPMYENAHATTQRLLPWYVNGTLDESERLAVAAHLAECAECRAELDIERELETDVASLALDVDQGWANMRERMAASTVEPPRVLWFRRRVPLGWAAAAQAIAALLLLTLLLPQHRTALPPADYRTLGRAPVAPKGNMIVMFAAGARESDLRQALARADARLVGGPTAAGAYLVEVTDAHRPQALQALRADKSVSLAEPIDPGAAP